MDRNNFDTIPTASLNGPKALRLLSLRNNKIGVFYGNETKTSFPINSFFFVDIIKSSSFQVQQSLENIDLEHNSISLIEGGAFEGLENLKFLYLAHNKLSKFNSDVFQGAHNLQKLDLSRNFIVELPTVALKVLTNLRYLNLSSNLIQVGLFKSKEKNRVI